MVRLLLHSCYGYGLLQEKHIRHHILEWIHQCIYRVTHTPYQCQMHQSIPLDSADISHDRPPYRTCTAGTIWPPVLSHMLYQRNEGYLKMEELVRPTTCSDVTHRYYPPDALIWRIGMRLGNQRRWLGLVEIVSAGSVPPGAVRRTIKSTWSKMARDVLADCDVGRI